jgi:hypothetical protein
MYKNGDKLVFKSGASRYAFTGDLSISMDRGEFSVGYGADGGFWDERDACYDPDSKLSVEDIIEMAESQIAMWEALRSKYAKYT